MPWAESTKQHLRTRVRTKNVTRRDAPRPCARCLYIQGAEDFNPLRELSSTSVYSESVGRSRSKLVGTARQRGVYAGDRKYPVLGDSGSACLTGSQNPTINAILRGEAPFAVLDPGLSDTPTFADHTTAGYQKIRRSESTGAGGREGTHGNGDRACQRGASLRPLTAKLNQRTDVGSWPGQVRRRRPFNVGKGRWSRRCARAVLRPDPLRVVRCLPSRSEVRRRDGATRAGVVQASREETAACPAEVGGD
jgi:hypothetical protein